MANTGFIMLFAKAETSLLDNYISSLTKLIYHHHHLISKQPMTCSRPIKRGLSVTGWLLQRSGLKFLLIFKPRVQWWVSGGLETFELAGVLCVDQSAIVITLSVLLSVSLLAIISLFVYFVRCKRFTVHAASMLDIVLTKYRSRNRPKRLETFFFIFL